MREEIHPHDAAVMPEYELEELALEGDFQAQYELEQRMPERMPQSSEPPIKSDGSISYVDCWKCGDGTVDLTSETAECDSCDGFSD